MPTRGYGWFDSPDGHDIIKKTDLAARVGFVVGSPIALFDHFMNPQNTLKGYGFRAALCILPCMGAGAAFALTSQALCKQYPKTRPELFYMVGAVAGGTVLGGAVRSVAFGSVASFYLAISAAMIRDLYNNPNLTSAVCDLPKHLDNDEELFQRDYRFNPQPMRSMPLPYARPGRPHSDLGLN